MPAHLDAPAAGDFFDPADFRLRGWLWLESAHGRIDALEALGNGRPLATIAASDLHERPDVTAHFRLPPGTRTGFDASAQVTDALTDDKVEIELRVRFRDGASTHVLCARRELTPTPAERHPFRMLLRQLRPHALGVEIGAHTNPAAELSPFYTDAVSDFAGAAGRVDFLADANALPLPDDTLDYLVSSHVLEHLPNPLAALHEWHRVLRPGGLLYLVVPDQRFTFDAPRATTTVEHLLRDFQAGVTAADTALHVDEFIFHTDWSRLSPHTAPADVEPQQAAARARYLDDLAQGRAIDIHYHTFTPDSLNALLRAAGFIAGESPRFELLAHAERYPPGREDGIALLLAKSAHPPPGSISLSCPPLATFLLPARSTDVAPLPLVCPLTLSPLRAEISSSGDRTLIAAGSGVSYAFPSGCPVLLPPQAATPRRSWTDHHRREERNTAPLRPDVLVNEDAVLARVDEPAPPTRIDPLCFLVRGWLWLGHAHGTLAAVEAWSEDSLIGETAALYERPDVSAAHGLPLGARSGFELFAHHAGTTPACPFTLEIRARRRDGSRTPVLATHIVQPIARDYRTNHFGVLLDQRTTAVQRHGNIFATGPSLAEGSGELALLLRRHLGPPPRRVIDVGCGLGSYGRGLLADGYDWIGAEIDAGDCAELARLGLPHRHVDGRALPFADGAFDAALCLEVLEHIEEPRAFLREVHRVAPRRLIVSVPNCELLGYLWDHLATPWHMLESTHVNFFTRWSLGALLREFYPHVELRFYNPYPLKTVEGTPLHYNLLAIARADTWAS